MDLAESIRSRFKCQNCGNSQSRVHGPDDGHGLLAGQSSRGHVPVLYTRVPGGATTAPSDRECRTNPPPRRRRCPPTSRSYR